MRLLIRLTAILALTSCSAAFVRPTPDLDLQRVLDALQASKNLEKRSVETWQYAAAIVNAVQVDVGTPAQSFTCLIDTGSTVAFIISKNCSDSFCGIESYDEQQSSTFKKLDEPMLRLNYADGTMISGDVVQDVLTLDNTTVSPFTFLNVQTYSKPQRVEGYPGMLGMGLPVASNASLPSELTKYNAARQMMDSGVNQFALLPAPTIGDPGQLSLGQIATSRYNDSLKWMPVTSRPDLPETFWTVTLTGGAVGTKKKLPSDATTVILDTGSTFTTLPRSIVREIGESLGGKELQVENNREIPLAYIFKCNDAKILPDIAFEMSGQIISIPATAYLHPLQGSECVLGVLAPSPSDEAAIKHERVGLMGMNLIRAFYSVWNWETRQVGFANLEVTYRTIVEIPADSSSTKSLSTSGPLAWKFIFAMLGVVMASSLF
ncbi:aspartic peptidase domain-containing protein [Gaertneriomyces semiglobifer]|nr:aspartic peptidase domain-containing protein [Gaertneriomyces semiglobifer]